MAKKTVRVAVKPKTIFLPIAMQELIGANKYILELRDKFNYAIQLTIE